MKTVSFLLAAALLVTPAISNAQDAAVQERLNKLIGDIDALTEAQNANRKRLEELAKEVANLREQQTKPNSSYASQDDVRLLTAKVKEIDEKRQNDNEVIVRKIDNLAKTLTAPPPARSTTPTTSTSNDKVFEYVIAEGDTLSLIAQAYREKNIKVTVKQILDANEGLVPEKLRPGTKIFIPKPE